MKLELRGHFVLVQFHSGRDTADAHVGAVVVISPQPLCGLINVLRRVGSKQLTIEKVQKMDWWVWLLIFGYLFIGFTKTTGRIASGRKGSSLLGTLIFGTLFWPIL